MVYDDAEEYYAKVAKRGRQLMQEALDALFDLPPSSALQSKSSIITFNPTMHPRMDIIKIPLSTTSFSPNTIVQASGDGSYAYVLVQSQHGSGYSLPQSLLPECRSPSGVS